MTEKNEIAASLAASNLFGNASSEALEAIADIAHRIEKPADTIVVAFTVPRANCYVIASGGVKLFRIGQTGHMYDSVKLYPGESFGEIALLTGEPIAVSAKTMGETSLIVIPGDRFGPILREYPDVISAIGKGVSRWLELSSSALVSRAERLFRPSRLSWYDLVFIIGFSVLCALSFNASNPKGLPLFQKSFADESIPFISASAAFEKIKKGNIIFIDAMPANFFEQEHIKDAVNIPLSIFDFMYDMSLGQTDKSKEIIVYGRTISKRYDEEIASKLGARGFKNVKILEGGFDSWKKHHYPVAP